MMHAVAWILGTTGAGLLLVAGMVWDTRRDAVLAVLVAGVGALLLSQGVRLSRLEARLRRAGSGGPRR